MRNITLIQPRHSYAPGDGQGHIYMPTSLLTAGARIMSAGGEVHFVDENLHEASTTAEVIGLNLLGAPYIPIALEMRKKIDRAIPMLLGGQVVSGLTSDQFRRIFGENTFNGNDDATLVRMLALRRARALNVIGAQPLLPAPEHTSLIPAYEKISDEDMREYLSREQSFYLSQGCQFNCEFCAADRSMVNPVTGSKKAVSERYRTVEVLEKDLRYLVARAERLGINHLNLYLSNLDLFQTPEKLLEFARIVIGIRGENPDLTIGLRGLATVTSFLNVHAQWPEVIDAIKAAGLTTVGFGIDGMTPKIWKSVKKGHNTTDKCIDAIRIARESYNMTPEVLMVFGHPKDTKQTLELAVEFALDMRDLYGAIPRPHVSKDLVPGNENWLKPENHERVERFIEHPHYFQALDFTALPSSLTHPNPRLRRNVEKYYRMMTAIFENTTQPIYPVSPDVTERENQLNRRLNEGKFDR